MPRILIAFDDSAPALRAVKQVAGSAGSMTWVTAVLLNVQHAVPVSGRIFDGSRAEIRKLEEPLRRAGSEMLRKAAALLDAAGVPHATFVEVGDPAPIIAECARRNHCDMLVMGTRGMGAVGNLLLGSVATKVLHLVKVPVMLVK
jgi:nucleotide-binding universal stress UspA family protein